MGMYVYYACNNMNETSKWKLEILNDGLGLEMGHTN